MLTVYLFKVTQNGTERYLGKAPGRLLAKITELPEMNQPQENQRPLDEKRLRDLANFVVGRENGILATSVVLGTTSADAVTVQPVGQQGDELYGKVFSIDLPQTNAEIQAMGENKIFKAIDGQHRLFSFLDEYCRLPESTDFELSFEMYLNPDDIQQKIIFRNTNEFQKAVPKNLLLYFRRSLGMLNADENEYYNIVTYLSNDASSPLHGRIQMNAERIRYKLTADQIIGIFNKICLRDIARGANDLAIFRTLKTYLHSWELEVGSNFADLDVRHTGPFCKISGFRFIMYLFPTFVDIATRRGVNIDENFVREQIRHLYNNDYVTITAAEFFDPRSEHNQNTHENRMFGGKSPTIALAEQYKKWLLEANENEAIYNPFDGH